MMMIQTQLLSNRPHRQLPFIVSSSVSMIYGVGDFPLRTIILCRSEENVKEFCGKDLDGANIAF
jgi:hypothetical protein